MTHIVFTIPGTPRGKGRPRATRQGNFVRMYTDDKTANFENLVKLAFLQACSDPPTDQALTVTVDAFFTPPKSASKKLRAQMLSGAERPTKKPDLDNILKAVLDGLNGVAFVDDAQVTGILCKKHYAEVACLKVGLFTYDTNATIV